jgi:cell wall-associated NlpC family hydrolase
MAMMMSVKPLLLLLIAACISACASPDAAHYRAPGPVKEDSVSAILAQAPPASEQWQGERISQISAAFLGTPYQADTLIGSPAIPEALVINFNGVDCFTLLDYVQALSRSHDRTSFEANLIRTRYAGGEVSYLKRRHFFTDWFAVSPRNADDITGSLSPDAVTVVKTLNRQASGKERLPDLGVIPRRITYLPARAITPQVLKQIQTGDYIGVYTTAQGLDVSHAGIAVRHDGRLWFRNASSLAANRKVVDAPFREYMRSKPGIIVLRAVPLTAP